MANSEPIPQTLLAPCVERTWADAIVPPEMRPIFHAVFEFFQNQNTAIQEIQNMLSGNIQHANMLLGKLKVEDIDPEELYRRIRHII